MSAENSKQFLMKSSHELKVGDVYVIESAGKYDYVKVGSIKNIKSGKHGSAKVVAKGNNILTGRTCDNSFTSGARVTTVKLKRSDYTMIDIDADEISVVTSGSEQNIQTLKVSDFDPKDIERLNGCINRDAETETTFSVVSAPDLCIVEDIRKDGKIFE